MAVFGRDTPSKRTIGSWTCVCRAIDERPLQKPFLEEAGRVWWRTSIAICVPEMEPEQLTRLDRLQSQVH